MKFEIAWGHAEKVSKATLLIFWGAVLVLAAIGLGRYTGQGYVFALFTVASNMLLYYGFRKNAIFFDTFIGLFTWLGFWLKFTVKVSFSGALFHDPVGSFNGSGASFDQALLVSSCGLFGFLLASIIRERFFNHHPQQITGISLQGLFTFYKNHRNAILFGFVALFFIVGISNMYLGIYQRGSITRTTLPFGLNGVYTWLLLFGLTTISALILKFELEIHKKIPNIVMFLALLESFVSNVSLLSRGMILNSSALLYGIYITFKSYSIKLKMRFSIITIIVFMTLFVSSVITVNYFRTSIFVDTWSKDLPVIMPTPESTKFQFLENLKPENLKSKNIKHPNLSLYGLTVPLFIDRWVGIEGVMAVSSYSKLGWNLWGDAWRETYNENEVGFYDKNFTGLYTAEDEQNAQHHFISLPGIIAFFFYPGSFLFLFVSMFALGGMGATIETFVRKISGNNALLCALIAQVVAYRYMHFGYVPGQSYLLFGTIFLNCTFIYLANKALLLKYNKTN
jgi:hypothetical protein